jgi:D-alanyl-D-alanine dipeptidase
MRNSLLTVVLACLLLSGCAGTGEVRQPGSGLVTAGSRQLLLVTAEGWDSRAGTLRRYERDSGAEGWRLVGAPVLVNLGRGGLGWGLGLHGDALGPGPEKREGDGRAPAGLFALGDGFAYDPAESGPLRIPVLRADADLLCVDDGASRFYNGFVRASQVPKDWNSAEDMLRRDGQYRFGVYVRHNTAPATPGRGSCIFLHIWLGRGVASSGCTNMDAADMLTLFRWLDASRTPLLAQLPMAEYVRLREAWGLPELEGAP